MKTRFVIIGLMALAISGCRSSQSLSQRAAEDEAYPHQEPFSRESVETLDEPAGASSQSRTQIENPFITPRHNTNRAPERSAP